MEGHGRSRKVKEGHGWSFPITRLTFQVRKVIGGVGGNEDGKETVSLQVQVQKEQGMGSIPYMCR